MLPPRRQTEEEPLTLVFVDDRKLEQEKEVQHERKGENLTEVS